MAFLTFLLAQSYYASVPQAPVGHAFQLFGEAKAGAPLFVLHGEPRTKARLCALQHMPHKSIFQAHAVL